MQLKENNEVHGGYRNSKTSGALRIKKEEKEKEEKDENQKVKMARLWQ